MKTHPEYNDTRELIRDVASVPPDSEEDYSVEAILAEFSSHPRTKTASAASFPDSKPDALPGLDENGTADTLTEVPPQPPAPESSQAQEAEASDEKPVKEASPFLSENHEASQGAQFIPLEDIVAQTVESVIEDEQQAHANSLHRGFLSHRSKGSAEQPESVPLQEQKADAEPELWSPEPEEAEDLFFHNYTVQRKALCFALPLMAVLLILHLPQWLGWELPMWSGSRQLQIGTFLFLQLLLLICGNGVFARSISYLGEKRISYELLVVCANLAAMADGISQFFSSAVSAPLILPASMTLLCALWGEEQKNRALYDSCHVAALGSAPYMVAVTPEGACKQRTQRKYFYQDLTEKDISLRWQGPMLPLLLIASLVFSVLSSFGQNRPSEFLWCLSAILTAAVGCSYPLIYGRSFSVIARRLKKGGMALAGYTGAQAISRSGRMIVTDSDLFPSGAVRMGGIRLFGEEIGKAASYASALAQAGGLPIARLFDELLEQGRPSSFPVEQLQFYEEGGLSAVIRGETVLLGSESFLRKMKVHFPEISSGKTELFLSIDRQLAASFALKYLPSDNTDWALHAMKSNHITPVLATRSPGITPALLNHRFGTTARAVYPPLAVRLALSEETQTSDGRIGALLYREGLMPYAEVTVGGKRLAKAVHRGSMLAVFGSVVSCLLAFYLAFAGAYTVLTPVALSTYLFLWLIPTFILSENVQHY